jgi:hypothetical protein
MIADGTTIAVGVNIGPVAIITRDLLMVLRRPASASSSPSREDLEEGHRLQFEKHAQTLQKIKSEVQARTEEKGTIGSFSSAEGMHQAVVDIVKAMKDLTSYFA